MNLRRYFFILIIIVVGFALLAFISIILVSVFPESNFDRVISLTANLGIILAILTLIHRYSLYEQTLKNQEKLNFVSMTARFDDLQKLFVGNGKLEALFEEIYFKVGQEENQTNTKLSTDEFAVCTIMFQIMEDVATMHDLISGQCPKQYEGWLNLFEKWLKSYRVKKAWNMSSQYYGDNFRKHINSYLEGNGKPNTLK
ncbi:MAG: hypothetical protein A2173_01315 [Planctomycetes bacterium RBG_13_44_8b]|nr:MAG: hypothetical protein A2173_01315 [Planctomycetes bacterium RBG_13_44_8b]